MTIARTLAVLGLLLTSPAWADGLGNRVLEESIDLVLDTGNNTDCDSTPTVNIYENGVDTPILNDASMSTHDAANTNGLYDYAEVTAAADGYEVGKSYKVLYTCVLSGVTKTSTDWFQVIASTVAVASIANDAITAASIANDAIDASEIAADSLGASELAADAIGASEIATDAIGAAEIAAAAITSSEAANLDAAITSRMATYTQPTGFLAATFPTTVSSLVVGDNIGINWADITNPTTAQNLSATNFDVDQVVASVSGAVGSVTGLTASDVGAIKTKTDSLTFTVANELNVNARYWNGSALATTTVAGVPEVDVTHWVGAVMSSQAVAAQTATNYAEQIIFSSTGTADSGSATTIVDAERVEADSYWVGNCVVPTSGTTLGQVRQITSFVASTDTITVSPAFTAAISTNTYGILRASNCTAGSTNFDDFTGTIANSQVDDDVVTVSGGAGASQVKISTSLGNRVLNELVVFSFQCTNTSGVAADCTSVPTYSVYENETTTAIATGSMAKLGSVAGYYTEQITLDPTGSLYESGKSYHIKIDALISSDTKSQDYYFQIIPSAVVVDLDAATGTLANSQVDDDVVVAGTSPPLASGTADSGTTTTMVDAALTQADDNYWRYACLKITSGNITGQIRPISAFTASSDTVAVELPFTQAVGTNTYEILGATSCAGYGGSVTGTLNRVTANVDQVDSIALDTHDAGSFPADVRTYVGATAPALVGGRYDASVGAYVSGLSPVGTAGNTQLDAAEIATNAFGASQFAPDWLEDDAYNFTYTISSESANSIVDADGSPDPITTDDIWNNRYKIQVFDTTTRALKTETCITDSTASSNTFATRDDVSSITATGDYYAVVGAPDCQSLRPITEQRKIDVTPNGQVIPAR